MKSSNANEMAGSVKDNKRKNDYDLEYYWDGLKVKGSVRVETQRGWEQNHFLTVSGKQIGAYRRHWKNGAWEAGFTTVKNRVIGEGNLLSGVLLAYGLNLLLKTEPGERSDFPTFGIKGSR
jgi:hypothetical protein